jgi:long-chain fatty acid transport protein
MGGISYQHSTEFNYSLATSVRTDPAGPNCAELTCPVALSDLSGTGNIIIPKVFGVGISFSPGDAWIISFQYNRITYSDLEPDLNALGELRFSDTTFRTGNYIYLEDFKVEDADELHLGIEYVILGNTPIAIRVGAWYDPDHQLRYVEASRGESGLTGEQQHQLADARKRLNIRFPGGEDQVHYTGGIGAVLGDNFQLELGFDIADRSSIYSLSAVVRF